MASSELGPEEAGGEERSCVELSGTAVESYTAQTVCEEGGRAVTVSEDFGVKGLETLSLGAMSAKPPAQQSQGLSGEKEDKGHEMICVVLFGCWSGECRYPAQGLSQSLRYPCNSSK